MSSYQAVLLYKGKRAIASKGDQQTHWRVQQIILYLVSGILAGMIGGLLGLGGGFILGPLFLNLGIPPQVPLILLFDIKSMQILWTTSLSLCLDALGTDSDSGIFHERWQALHPPLQ